MQSDRVRTDLEHYIEAHRNRLVDFACRLVAAPSMNPPGDERPAAAVVTQELLDLGLGEPTVFSQEPSRPNLVRSIAGTGRGPTLMLSGHLDTKPPGDLALWRTNPLTPTISDGRLYGLGACDMKGAVAAMVYAAAALQHGAGAFPGSLALVFTADEEGASTKGAAYLADVLPFTPDACLIGEPSGIATNWQYIHLISRGIVLCKIGVHGTQMHSSLSDILPAVNASEMLARVLVATRDRLRLRFLEHPLCPGGPTVNPGVTLKGGMTYGVVPGYAEFGMDIRCLPGMTLEGVLEDVQAFLDEEQRREPRLNAELTLETAYRGWVPPTEIPPRHPLVVAVQDAGRRVLGSAPPLSAFPGGTDAAIFQGRLGIPTLPSFGPGLLSMAHSPNEYVPVDGIVEAARMYAQIAYQYLHTTVAP